MILAGERVKPQQWSTVGKTKKGWGRGRNRGFSVFLKRAVEEMGRFGEEINERKRRLLPIQGQPYRVKITAINRRKRRIYTAGRATEEGLHQGR